MTPFCSPPQNGAMDKVRAYLLLVTLAVVVIALWFLTALAPIYACSCIMPGAPSEELEKSAAVFAGKVLSIEKDRQLKVNFAVNRVWKGRGDKTTSMGTAQHGASCGFTFSEGEEYIVYSRDGATVSLCSRTKLIADAQGDLDALGAGNRPVVSPLALRMMLRPPVGAAWPRPLPLTWQFWDWLPGLSGLACASVRVDTLPASIRI